MHDDGDRRPTGPEGLDRRDLLAAAAALGVGAAWLDGALDLRRAQAVRRTRPGEAPQTLSPEAWRALEAALARLLPSDDLGIGAPEVGAIGYLDGALAAPEASPITRSRVLDGAARLDRRAREAGAPHFAALAPAAQDEAIAAFEGSPGGRLWLEAMIGFALEAFLGDPVRGANPQRRGWRWADHEPGWPRPETPGWRPREVRP